MEKDFYVGNRQSFYKKMKAGSCLLLFSGEDVCKTNDEAYDFFADRNFLYLTGIEQKQTIFLAIKRDDGEVKERLYILPKDDYAERWTGRRLTKEEAAKRSGVEDVRTTDSFDGEFHRLANSHLFESIYLDLYKCQPQDRNRPAHIFLQTIRENYPYLAVEDGSIGIRQLRLYKQPCEIEALRKSEEITREGIIAMMQNSKPGLYEYQYKANFDHALGQHGARMTGFPPIISAGDNNFCIHYYDYTGQAKDGDMILNDVGVSYDGMICDVSRGFPCNGKFTDKQKLLYNCAYETSNYMFSIIKPGMKMADVDRIIKEYNAKLLVEAGVLDDVTNVAKYMWHGGAHHIGFDVHDVVATPEVIEPNMVFCVDVGIYHEEWGIGFRLEDNCLVTEDGCENLSKDIPRSIEEIERIMK